MRKNKTKSPREIALDTIIKIKRGMHIQKALDMVLSNVNIKRRDCALITELVYAYFRLKARLNFVLKSRIRGQFKKLPERFVLCMCLGVYEILYLDRIPDYASVNFYVEFIKKKVNKGLTSLANGVLRTICRNKEELISREFYLENTRSRKEFYSIYYSIPICLVDLLVKQYGCEDAEIFLKKSIIKPYIGIRINKKKRSSKEVINILTKNKSTNKKLEDRLFALEDASDIDIERLEQEGIISRKSFESQKILFDLSKDKWNLPIWDMCAGFGGKLTLLLEEDKAPIWASDIDINRLKGLKREISRLGLDDVPVFVSDCTKSDPLKKSPNTILIDSPCSGLGVINRRPDLKWRIDHRFLKEVTKVQERLLNKALKTISTYGRVVYITCTWNREENEGQILKLVENNRDIKIKIEKEVSINFSNDFREFFYGVVLVKN
ncbi:16S rRNA (cytosine(967)-C(5))-methyltransferase RsmB [Desulfothermus okinawensis JCM 13304]